MSTDSDPRVYFAAERTLLAWLRTAIAVIGLGFLVARFGVFLTMIRGHQLDGDQMDSFDRNAVGPASLNAIPLND